MCGGDGHRPCAGVHDLEALRRSGRRRAAGRTRTARTPRRRCCTVPPGTPPRAADGERQPARGRVVDVDAGLAQPVEQRGHRPFAGVRVAVEVHRRRPARRPAGRSASRCRPGRCRSLRRAAGPGSTTQSGAVVGSTVDAERAQRVGHQLGVAGPQRRADARRAVGERGQHQRAVGQRLGPGQLDTGRVPAACARRRRATRGVSVTVQSAAPAGRYRRSMCGRYVSVRSDVRPARRVRRHRRHRRATRSDAGLQRRARPSRCASSSTGRCATPTATAAADADAATAGRVAGDWSRRGPRTAATASACSTRGSRAVATKPPSARRTPSAAASSRPTAGTSGSAAEAPKARKQPFYMTPVDGHAWPSPGCTSSGGRPGRRSPPARSSPARPQGALAEIHDRMPLRAAADGLGALARSGRRRPGRPAGAVGRGRRRAPRTAAGGHRW